MAMVAAAVAWLHLLAMNGLGERPAAVQRGSSASMQVRSIATAMQTAAAVAPPVPEPVWQSSKTVLVTPRRSMPQAAPPRRQVAAPPSAAVASPALPATAVDAKSYPTRLPPSATLHYELRRGLLVGDGALHWQHDGERYDARLDAQLGGSPVLQWASRGGFDAAGIAPDRFVAQGRRRSAQAVNFQRGAGKITFSGPTVEHALEAGAQDRLSWMLQLAAIAAARPPAAGAEIVMQVAGPRGDAEAWQFDVVGDGVIDTGAGPLPALRLVREPRRRYDTRIEVWLDPARHHLPVRALLGHQDDGRDPLELLLRKGTDENELPSP